MVTDYREGKDSPPSAKMHERALVITQKWLLLVTDFNQTWNVSTNVRQRPQPQ